MLFVSFVVKKTNTNNGMQTDARALRRWCRAICFLVYWITARLKSEWSRMGERREVASVLRELQQIKVGRLKMGEMPLKVTLTDIPGKLYAILEKPGLPALFQRAPAWAS